MNLFNEFWADVFEEKPLTESKDLYKGIFWIVDLNDIEKNKDYCFQIPVSLDGTIVSDNFISNAKSGSTYNHEKTWKTLSSKLTHNKPFDYYPRGRVEIKNGLVDIFLNPNINTPEIINFLKKEFNLNDYNGIKKFRVHSDNSEHYRCYLDK